MLVLDGGVTAQLLFTPGCAVKRPQFPPPDEGTNGFSRWTLPFDNRVTGVVCDALILPRFGRRFVSFVALFVMIPLLLRG